MRPGSVDYSASKALRSCVLIDVGVGAGLSGELTCADLNAAKITAEQ